jgi:predicted dehydrogenase
MSQVTRVGLIRCDTHGAYFAALMAKHDPAKLQRPVDLDSKPPYTWMAGGTHFYFYTNYCDPRIMSVETVDGFEVVNVWDEHRVAAETLSRILDSHPRVCDSFEQVSDGVDLVFIGDCNGDGSDHLKLATPGLQKGVSTYIDKPLANEVGDVDGILALSKKHRAPVFSASILRHMPQTAQFRARLPEVGRVESGCIRGGGLAMAGQVHTVSLAQAVFGNGIQEVRAMGPDSMGVMHLSWGDRPDRPSGGVVLQHNVREMWHCTIHISAYGPEGGILATNLNDWYFPFGAANILKLVKKMVLTGEVDQSMGDMMEAIAVLNAGRLSLKEGSRPVKVADLRRTP